MTITVKKGEETLYHQKIEDSKTLNAVVAYMMTLPSGTAFNTAVANNGHTMDFNTSEVDVQLLIRKGNDIATKKPAAKKAEAVEA